MFGEMVSRKESPARYQTTGSYVNNTCLMTVYHT